MYILISKKIMPLFFKCIISLEVQIITKFDKKTYNIFENKKEINKFFSVQNWGYSRKIHQLLWFNPYGGYGVSKIFFLITEIPVFLI